MIQLPPDFLDLLQAFADAKVEYLLVGGYAVMFHGYPRATKDLDLWISATPANIQAVKRALAAFGAPAILLNTISFLDPQEIFFIGVAPLRIEVFTAIPGVDFAACYQQRVSTIISGVPLSLISLADLKQNKQASGRPRDLDDLQNLP
jgi:hypothetical protein